MPDGSSNIRPLDPRKFQDPDHTARGEARAHVAMTALSTVWFNTGTLCNITCHNCYIESSPRNDRLAYLTRDEVATYLDEIAGEKLPVIEIGFTGGEPFMNPHFPAMLGDTLDRGISALVLTNGMKPLWNKRAALLDIHRRHGDRLTLRVSVDHYTLDRHESVRGKGTWAPTIQGLRWLAEHGIHTAVAGRTLWDEPEDSLRAGYGRLFAEIGLPVDARNPAALVLFPEMDAHRDVPEITTACWDILDVSPDSLMCASSRMVIKRKGADGPVVAPCTLLPYETAFEMGPSLAGAMGEVKLNHPHCARFCVLGGASCSPS